MGTPGSSPVKEATILATNAPEMSSNVFQYGETTIYVPKGATGYTGGYWDRYTIKTIEDTEPATEFTITTSRTDGCHLSYVCGDNSGELAANDSVLVPAGADVSFGVTNFVGYRIVDVKIDGVSQPLTSEYNFSYTFNDVDKNHSIAVTCEPVEEHEIAVPTAKTGLIYNGSEQIGVAEGTGYTLTGHKATNAGNYTATATLSSGYKWDDGTKTPKTITWSIAKKGVTFPTAGAGLVYNGQEQIGVPASTDGSYTLTNGKAVDAGSYEAAVTLVNTTNYQWADGIAEATRTITWTIAKAPAFALTGNAVIVKNQPDYTVEINLTKLANYPANTGNTPTFAVTDTEPYHGLDSATIDATGKLTLTADNTANETADSVNISLRDMKNYADSTITITVNYTDKAVVAISGITVAEKTYDGKAVAYTGNPIFTADGATVTPQGYSLTWENAAGEKLESAPKDAGSYKLIITIAESDPLYVGSAEVSCQIAKRPVSVMPKDISVKRNGNATFVLTYVGLVEGESLTPSVTPTFTLTDADKQEVTSADAVKTVGSYTITWSNMADTTFADAANYEVTKEATGTLTVKRPSGGGSLSGGSGSSSNDDSHDIQVEEDTANGKVEASTKDAESGDSVTITITPDEGYQLEKLTVTDADGKVLELKEAGDNKYTFTMPESEVEIKATFTEKADTGLPFLDVDTDDWYYEAAKYVYETGMMNGVDSTSFAPNASTTRGMIVAVLYRLEGSPAVSGSSFTDVAAGQYYADAVAWAAANEIVEGYDENTFAPADAVTREQLASILYRYAQFKGYDTTQGGMAIREFSDYTAISQWATEAMTWAINAELINGNENSALLPQGKATRAEVATMLMRFVTNLTTK